MPRVRGLSLCTGDYVIFLDQDDRLREDAVATFIATMKKYQTEADKVHATLGQEFSRTKIAQIMRYPVLVSMLLWSKRTERSYGIARITIKSWSVITDLSSHWQPDRFTGTVPDPKGYDPCCLDTAYRKKERIGRLFPLVASALPADTVFFVDQPLMCMVIRHRICLRTPRRWMTPPMSLFMFWKKKRSWIPKISGFCGGRSPIKISFEVAVPGQRRFLPCAIWIFSCQI